MTLYIQDGAIRKAVKCPHCGYASKGSQRRYTKKAHCGNCGKDFDFLLPKIQLRKFKKLERYEDLHQRITTQIREEILREKEVGKKEKARGE